MNPFDLPAMARRDPRIAAGSLAPRGGPGFGHPHVRWLLAAAAGVTTAAALALGYDLHAHLGPGAPSTEATAVISELRDSAESTIDDNTPRNGKRLVSPEALLGREARRSSSDEASLFEIYGLMASGRTEAALPLARRLAAERPAFGLAQLVYADLLTAPTRSDGGFAAAPVELTAPARERVAELTAEAQARVQAAAFAPPLGSVPEPFLMLDRAVKHAIAVDTRRSRVYVIENGEYGPRLVREYYASIGKLGMLKRAEGDQRTPLGVYFVTRELAPKRLAERYGSRAMVLNYPNPYDRAEGRTGDGIWLHGVSANDYVRPPWATDGCIALANPQIEELTKYISPQGTPILVAEHIDWVMPQALAARQSEFLATFERWRAARDTDADDTLQSFYSTDLTVPEVPAMGAPWRQLLKDEQVRRRQSGAARVIGSISAVRWIDRRELMVVTFSEGSAPNSADQRVRRQYWVREGRDWHIFYERSLG
jgi:L,D-transpeptidase YnhG